MGVVVMRVLSLLLLLVVLCVLAVGAEGDMDRVAVIELKGIVDHLMLTSLKRRMAEAREEGAKAFILSITTYGGYLQDADEIVDFISEQDERIVAYVKHRALSAGTLIALASGEMFLAPDSIIGDCGPLLPAGFTMSEQERIKAVSYIVTRLKELARRGGYPEALAVGMADSEVIVYSLVVKKDGEERNVFVLDDELQSSIAEWEDRGWSVVAQGIVKGEGSLLLLDTQKAVSFGFCSGVAEDEVALAAELGFPESALIRTKLHWLERLASFITSTPPLLLLLLVVGGLLLYTEFKIPGFGLPGILGILCLSLVFFSAYLGHLASVIELLMIVAGVLLILLEVLVIPGFGVAGISGILLLLAGFILSLQEFTLPKSVFEVEVLKTNFMVVFGSIVVMGIGIALMSRYLPKSKRFERLLILTPAPAEEVHGTAAPQSHLVRVGDVGVTETPLRPAGKARFGDKLVDVTTEGGFVDAGERVSVVETTSNRVVVRREEG